MFTVESFAEVKAIFNHHALQQKKLPGGLGMGELEIEVLSMMVADFSGNDAYGSTIQSLESQLIWKYGNNFEDIFTRFEMNGKDFRLNIYEITEDEVDDGEMEGPPGWKVVIHTTSIGESLKVWEETHSDAVQSAFRVMRANEVCQACGNLLLVGHQSYCDSCSRYWNDKGCKTCLGKVGYMEDGEHSACKRRRLE
jgi:hypothetical protein